MTSNEGKKDNGESEKDAEKKPSPSGGEDESSTETEGDDRHLHDDQKAPSFKN